MKHLRTTFDFDNEATCLSLLHRAQELKRARTDRRLEQTLHGFMLAMWFEKPSTRTRISFDAGMALLGGSTVVIHARDAQTANGETSPDAARVIGGYVDALVVRSVEHSDLEEFARHAGIPIINGMTSLDHPCQALADVLTVYERKEHPFDLNWAWVGDVSTVTNALVAIAGIFKLKLTIAAPKTCQVDQSYLEKSKAMGATIHLTEDAREAVSGAHVIMTDSWSRTNDEAWQEKMLPYQLNASLLKEAADDHFLLHGLPANRGQEITEDVMEGRHSLIYEQADNRLPVQQAILEWLLLSGGTR